MRNFFLLLLFIVIFNSTFGQTIFPSPGAQTICSTTSTTLNSVTSTDGLVTIKPYLWLSNSCLDTDLALFSLNTPAQYRKPTFCYNNGYFPASYGNPLAISRNSTANGGNCEYAESHVVSDFTTGSAKPTGLSFIVCDVDNPYDTIRVEVWSGGAKQLYSWKYMETDPLATFVWMNALSTASTPTSGSGTSVNFNGGNPYPTGWGSASATTDWEKEPSSLM